MMRPILYKFKILKILTVIVMLLSASFISTENLFAKETSQLSSFLRNISGTWEETDTINGNIHRNVWTFEVEFENSGSGDLSLYINDSLSPQSPQPFVWMMHELKDNTIVLQIRVYKDLIEYLWEIQSVTKSELHFTCPDYKLTRVVK